jgi:Domain of unknown function (DUF1707)
MMASQHHWITPFFGRDPNLRAADADREATAERLRQSHAEGRLDTDELQERLERCYGAKTLGELEQVVTDLPREASGSERSAFSPRLLRPWRWRLAPFAPLLIALIVVSAVTGHHLFWVFIPLAFLFWRMCWWRWRPWRTAGRAGPDEWV